MSNSIMVVDDEPGLCDLVKAILGRRDYEVSAVQEGEKALLKIEEKTPDLLLLDINMPGLDGWDVLRELYRRDTIDEVPVAMLTCEKLELTKVLRKDMDFLVDYIEKPFKPAQLLETVEKLLKKTRKIRDVRDKIVEKSSVQYDILASAFVAWSRTQMIHKTLLEKLEQMKSNFYNEQKLSRIERLIESEEQMIHQSKIKREEVLKLTGIGGSDHGDI